MEIDCPYFSAKLFTETNILTFKQFISVSYMCQMDAFIIQSAIDAKRNLSNSTLHLNIRGSFTTLQENFAEVFERLF